ncbi:MAG: glycogen-binding domain-containing protein [Gemmatimonadaceae bacterium]|nr:glycogen-binding domain-containing protein [Gemmatimonadaceae bacterium]
MRRTARWRCVALALVVAMIALRPVVVQAQSITRAWIDAGAAVIRPPRSTARPALTLGVGGEHLTPQWRWRVDGALAVVSDSLAVTLSGARAEFAPQRATWSHTTLDVGATTFGITSPTTNGNTQLAIAQTVTVRSVSVTGGWSSGRTQRGTLLRHGSALGGAVHVAVGPLAARVHAQRVTTNDWPLMEAAGYGLRTVAPNYVLADVGVDLEWRWRSVALQVARAQRTGRDATTGQSTAHLATLSWQARETWQLVAQAGQQLADPVRAVPQVSVATVQFRHALTRRPAQTAIRTSREVQLTREAQRTHVTLRIDAAPDAVVEIATSYTGWAPQRIGRDGTQFVGTVALPSGAHRVAVRINGGAWRAPHGLVTVDDELGGTVGIVVVP